MGIYLNCRPKRSSKNNGHCYVYLKRKQYSYCILCYNTLALNKKLIDTHIKNTLIKGNYI